MGRYSNISELNGIFAPYNQKENYLTKIQNSKFRIIDQKADKGGNYLDRNDRNMNVGGKNINEWANIIAEQRKEFEKLSPEEKQRIAQTTKTIFDRWQAETEAMTEENESLE
ncbi:MAG: hypothetical protein LBJ63_05430 [Prevotellaceae bacterium]|jgi:hypothetical protein|nr:hypothetical protein [Prevotellaceae bacterium]